MYPLSTGCKRPKKEKPTGRQQTWQLGLGNRASVWLSNKVDAVGVAVAVAVGVAAVVAAAAAVRRFQATSLYLPSRSARCGGGIKCENKAKGIEPLPAAPYFYGRFIERPPGRRATCNVQRSMCNQQPATSN